MSHHDIPLLSEDGARALTEFFEQRCIFHGEADTEHVEEDWNLSQFWYTEETARTVCCELEAVFEGKPDSLVACISCPTLFRQYIKRQSKFRCTLFEFDARFAKLGEFVHYDYNHPDGFDARLLHQFDTVVADPPYLSEECLVKTLQTTKLLLKENSDSRVYLLTGEVMKDVALREADLKPVEFRPEHENKLGNAFLLYTNKQPTHYLGSFQS